MTPVYVFSTPSANIPNVRVKRGFAPPRIESGHARWEVVDRVKRRSAVLFSGSDPLRMSVPILFDGWSSKTSVEHEISNIERMRHIIGGEPPIVKVAGGVPAKGISWVIEGIDYTDQAVIWITKGGVQVRSRQDMTINLLEKIDAEIIILGSGTPGNSRGNAPSKTRPGVYIVKAGDANLGRIAVKLYHDRKMWKKIADANGIRDPNNISVNQQLVLP